MTCSNKNKNFNKELSKIGAAAVEAMLCEAAATPKPGLVDMNNSGAHADMDFFTFMSSVSALRFVFDEFADLGFTAAVNDKFDDKNIKLIWPELKGIGLKAEDLMFEATCGVNTHKGEIFSLGLLSSCAGWLIGKNEILNPENILNLVKIICHGLCDRDLAKNKIENKIKDKIKLNHGEEVFLKYGFTGIRGEAESGYATVKNISLPVFLNLMNKNFKLNDALVITLIYLIAYTSDTNILSRHNAQILEYSRNYAAKVLDFIKFEIKRYNSFTPAAKGRVELMDKDFTEKNISPGGCSDLLAVTYFLYKFI